MHGMSLRPFVLSTNIVGSTLIKTQSSNQEDRNRNKPWALAHWAWVRPWSMGPGRAHGPGPCRLSGRGAKYLILNIKY